MKSYQQAPSRKSKKRESAIKGKENKPVACSKGLFACERPRGRVGIRKRLIEAAVEDALVAFCGTRRQKPDKPINGRDARCPSFSDEQLWAKFAWRFGWGMLRELTLQGVAEMREHRRPLEDRDKPKVLQRLINGVWKDNKRTTAREAKRNKTGVKPKIGRLGSIGADRVDVGSGRGGVGAGNGGGKDSKRTTAREAV